ncbi:MAG TPA: lactate racemase domain-containing protein [Eubacteriales bacterium]|nr:lactate racemase domain-containing protein [Eubacteriales bacterium]
MKLELPQNAFQGNAPVSIELPDDWRVAVQRMPADGMPALTKEQVRERINRPYGTPKLAELAKQAHEVCIVFDDISRGTPTKVMAQCVLDELHAAGIRREQIRFICALGTHGANNRVDFANKLGEEIVHDYTVYNHNCYENTVRIGKTKRGFDVCINSEFMRCDLKIGLGAITPHTMNAFGGGGKLFFPGIASIETVRQNHQTAVEFFQRNGLNSSSMMGELSVCDMRLEIEEMTRMIGQTFVADCLYNSRLEPVGLYAGDPVEAYYAAIPAAKEVYAVPRLSDMDVVIVNVNAKATEATVASGLAALELKKSGGDVVIVDHTRLGQATHYLFGAFGHGVGGRMFGGMPTARAEVDRYICWMPYPDLGAAHWIGELEKQIYVDTWEEALRLLKERHGPGTCAAVITEGSICYLTQPD